jgi:hypothetical protein
LPNSFRAAGISQLDGVASDGIHLFWSTPDSVPFSVRGFDIQRRVASVRDSIVCYTASPSEIEHVNATLRLTCPAGLIALQESPCPKQLDDLPDEPFTGSVESPGLHCLDFRTYALGSRPKPSRISGVEFQIRDSAELRIASTPYGNGLDCAKELVIRLDPPVRWVSLMMAHLKPPATLVVLNRDGSLAGRETLLGATNEAETVEFTGSAINQIALTAQHGASFLLRICTASAPPPPVSDENEQSSRRNAARDAPVRSVLLLQTDTHAAYAVASRAASETHRCYIYNIDLLVTRSAVRVTVGVPYVIAIGLRDRKVVHLRYAGGSSGIQTLILGPSPIDSIRLYVGQLLTFLQICFTKPLTAEQEEGAWGGAPYIAKGIQLPLQTLDPALATSADEVARASSRVLPGEAFDPSQFGKVAEILNEAVSVTKGAPQFASHLTRDNTDAPPVEVRSWPFGLSLSLRPTWRRVLGLGYLDRGAGLNPGQRYEYRITGYFKRGDLEETFRGFHTVPVGTLLPPTFHLGPILFQSASSLKVTFANPPANNALEATSRKGVTIGAGYSPTLLLEFETPVAAVSLELEPRPGDDLTWNALSAAAIPGLTGAKEDGVVAIARRVDLQFNEPMQTLVLTGRAFLYGVRVFVQLPSPGTSPDDILVMSAVTDPITYETTPMPNPPLWVGTVNLQEPIVPGDPVVATSDPPKEIGFRVLWLPPPATGNPVPIWWPDDLSASPPTDVAGYRLERRQVDGAGVYASVGDADLLFYGSRGSRPDPIPLGRGADLLEIFRDQAPPRPPVPIFIDAQDVLIDPDGSGPPPGSLHQYRVSSVDVLGRASSPTVGSVVRLEKHIAPPQPVGPPAPADGYGPAAPAGVRARVIQSNSATQDILLEWGWRDQEAQLDPFATEFRIYLQTHPPDLVRGQLTGTATLQGSAFRMAATLDLPVAADEMVGSYLDAGGYPFRVAANTAGTTIVVDLQQSALETSQIPKPSTFVFMRQVTGEALRASAMERRVAVQPIVGTGGQQYTFQNAITLDPDHPRARVWVGVSSADSQAYVPDELSANSLNGGRPGNESRVVVAAASASYVGQPTFTVDPPLPDVPELVLNEPTTNDISFPLDLPMLMPGLPLPAGNRVRLERLSVDSLLACLRANDDDTIGVTLPTGDSADYTLDSAEDQSDFLAEIRSGTPARIENRFIMDLLTRYMAGFESLWTATKVGDGPIGPVVDKLPGKAERYLHRIRAVDAAGHVSAGSAVVPQVVRVPSLRSPAGPRLSLQDSSDDTLRLTIDYQDGFDVRWLAVFTVSRAADEDFSDAESTGQQLLRQPNLRNRYPNDGIRVRLAGGEFVAPTSVVAVMPGPTDGMDRSSEVILTPGFGMRVAVWAVVMTRDGIPSALAGPKLAITAPPPLVPPALTLAATPQGDQAIWTATGDGVQLRLERSLDAGGSWSAVTPWLPGTTTTRTVSAAGAGARSYRLVLRDGIGRVFAGEPTPI